VWSLRALKMLEIVKLLFCLLLIYSPRNSSNMLNLHPPRLQLLVVTVHDRRTSRQRIQPALNLLLDRLLLGASDGRLGALRLELRASVTRAARVESLLQ